MQELLWMTKMRVSIVQPVCHPAYLTYIQSTS